MDWQPELLQQALQAQLAAHGGEACEWPVKVDAVDEVDSTNTRLLAQAASDESACLRVLVANRQSVGRGRMGRAWHSSPGASLTFSVSLPQPEGSSTALSLAVAAAVADALDPAPAHAAQGMHPQLMVKWPNDLWLRDGTLAAGGRKCAGILIETTTAASRVALVRPQRLGAKSPVRTLVIGLGVNLARPRVQPGADYDAAGLCELTQWSQAFAEDPAKAAMLVFHTAGCAVVRAVLSEAAHGADAWHASFADRDVLKGHRVSFHAAEGPVTDGGVARGVDRFGALLVEREGGGVVPIVSGEVSVRLA